MNSRGHSLRRGHWTDQDRPLIIGLVNNTAERALKSTERQFLGLLQASSCGIEVQPKFFTCSGTRRSAWAMTGLEEPYRDIGELFDTRVDGLIVTGMEPQTADLRDEPVWQCLARLVDWAQIQAVPTIWSCLAAHAAVLHLDGICRQKLDKKLSGVFDTEVVSTDHPLMAGLPLRWVSPHSRYYDLPETLLNSNGYNILSRSAGAGIDVFEKTNGPPFVFFQGHLEYQRSTLPGEYKRDVRRYLNGERDEYPIAPVRCFDTQTTYALARLRQNTLEARRDIAVLDQVASLISDPICCPSWYEPAGQIYANWLNSITTSERLISAPRYEQPDKSVAYCALDSAQASADLRQ